MRQGLPGPSASQLIRSSHFCPPPLPSLPGEAQEWVFLMLTTVGRGGDGQSDPSALFLPPSIGEAQEWVRLMLTTVGRGGDGQRIRDEILHIMHRNHIPETKGLWMEQWHQKLHNNTTPDDVPICEAYIAFLEANGNKEAYWRVLSDAGGRLGLGCGGRAAGRKQL